MGLRDSLLFKYRGRTSDEMGLFNVNVGSGGMLEETFMPTRTIIEQKIKGRPSPYFMGFEYEPLVIPVSFAFKDSYSSDAIREVVRWLTPDYYEELTFESNWNRRFFAMPDADSKLIHNGLSQGYCQFNFHCNSPFGYSPMYLSPLLDYSNNPAGGSTYTFQNLGDTPLKPIITIQVINGGTVKIVNTSNGGQKLEFTGLANNETITIDCQEETIDTDIALTSRYDNMVAGSEFLEMVVGNNYLVTTGNCKIKYKYEAILNQF